jgi:hypothetical protein
VINSRRRDSLLIVRKFEDPGPTERLTEVTRSCEPWDR